MKFIPLELKSRTAGHRDEPLAPLSTRGQHKEKTPKDPTIREKFNTCRFADYKEHVIDLLARVTRVSVETMEIVDAMKAAKR